MYKHIRKPHIYLSCIAASIIAAMLMWGAAIGITAVPEAGASKYSGVLAAKTQGMTSAVSAQSMARTGGAAAVAATKALPQSAASKQDVGLIVNGSAYRGRTILYNSTTYVALREFASSLGNYKVTWNASSRTANITGSNISVSAQCDAYYIVANGRYLWCENRVFIRDDTLFVPVRPIVCAFGGTVDWDASARLVNITRSAGAAIASGDSAYRSEDVLWLSRIIYAESRGESLKGKVAVGNVVLNRVRSSDYPNSIKEVVFDTKFGVQFTPVSSGTIYNTPDEESVIAAKLCLDGATLSTRILYFINEELATNLWVTKNCTYVMTVGSHDFYA